MGIKLGDVVEDTVTGFWGTAVARGEYLNGCVRFGIQPFVIDEGKLPEWEWIDEQQLRVTERDKPELAPAGETGGPCNAPPRW